jgi:MoaA/NifB/PqqE/SkfB family radical SAM enzyme
MRSHLVSSIVLSRFRHRPHTLSHLLTGRCNARCPTCLWRDPGRDELDTQTIGWLYREAARTGISQVVLWGGEPLLRPDLPAILKSAKDAGLLTTLVTNGRLAGECWRAIRGLVDVLILSLDDAGVAHDRLRGVPGLFACLDRFARTLHSDPLRPTLLVNTVLSRLNPGALRRVAPIVESWGAGFYFCPMETGQMRDGRFAPILDDLALPPDGLREAAALARTLKGAGYPLLATDAYLHLLEDDPGLTSYTCRAPRAILTVEADGAVRDCTRRERPLLMVSDLMTHGGRLADVFALPRYRQMLTCAERCTACNNPDVIEISWLWELRPAMLEKALELVRLRRRAARSVPSGETGTRVSQWTDAWQ